MIQEDIKALLPQDVFLLDVKEDFHQGVLKCVIDAEKPVDLHLTSITIDMDGKPYSSEAEILAVKDDKVLIQRSKVADEWIPILDIIHAKVLIKF